jgi:outer membrane lipoprotein-sorting protein
LKARRGDTIPDTMIDPGRLKLKSASLATALLMAMGWCVPEPALAQSPSSQPRISFPQKVPLPPRRPAGLGGASPTKGPIVLSPSGQPQPAPSVSAAPSAARSALAPASGPSLITPEMSTREVIEKVNAALNAVPFMSADFSQVGSNGKRLTGSLTVLKPGRLRFEYDPPATVDIVADGNQVAITDRKLKTQDLYQIGQTPLKFILKNGLDLARDTTVTGIEREKDRLTVYLDDKSTFGGTSKIALMFDPATLALKQWVVTDPQGYETLVRLDNIDTKTRPENDFFVINRLRN